MADSDRSRKEYLQHRQVLVEGQASQYDAYDKYMLVLAGGAFGVSFSFVDRVVDSPWSSPAFILLGWACFALAILVTLISFLSSQKAYEREIQNLDITHQHPNAVPKRNQWAGATGILNTISMMLFVVGTAMIIAFVWANV